MISSYGRRIFAPVVALIVARLKAWGVTPNGLTVSGFAMTALAALLLARGEFIWGALLLALASFFDMLDGSLARATEQSSKFGAFIDSTLDRYSESVTFLALAVHYSSTLDTRMELLLTFVILIGSLMVSYTRARAEALGVECKGGMLQRPERIILLIGGLLTGWMLPVLWIMAVLTNISALQRIYEVYVQTNQVATSASPTAQTPNVPGETPPVQ